MVHDNIRTDGKGKYVMIINGGNPLEGCPKSYEEANAWADKANEGKEEDYAEPNWKFDCGFKLDFDGPILRVSSRFYPPKSHCGPTWDGNVTIYVFDKEIDKKSFGCNTLNELKEQVEAYVDEWKKRVENNAAWEKKEQYYQLAIAGLLVAVSFLVFTVIQLW